MNDHDLRALATALLKRYAAEEEQVSKMFDAIVIDRGEHVPLPEITEEERALLNMLGGRKGNSLEHKRGSLASRGCSCNCNCNCGNCGDDDDDDDDDDDSSESASADSSASAAADNAAAADSESASAAEAGASMSASMSADNAAAADAESASAAEAGASMSASMSSEDATTASVSDAVAGDPSVSAEAAATAEENATTSEKGEVADSFGSLLGSISDDPDAPSAGATPASGQLSSELSAQLNEALANAVEEGDINDDALSQQSLDALAAQNADLDATLSGITAGLNAGDLSGMLGSTSVADQAANLTGASLDAASLSPDSAFSSNFTGIGTVGSNVTNADSKAGLQATSESVPGDVADQVDNMFANTRADTISPNVDDAITDESSKEGLQLGAISTTNVNQGPTIAGLNKDDLSDVFSGRQSLLDALNNTQMTSLTIHGGKSAIDGTKGETVMGPVFGGPVNDVVNVDLVSEEQASKDAVAPSSSAPSSTSSSSSSSSSASAAPGSTGSAAPANSGIAAAYSAAKAAASKGELDSFMNQYGSTAVTAGQTNYAGALAALGPTVMAELQAANRAAQATAAGGAALGGSTGQTGGQTAATTPSTTAATAPAATTSPTTTAQQSTVSQPSVVAQTGAGKTGATTGAGTGETASSATGYDKGASTYTGIGLIDSKINNALNNPGTTLVNAGVSLVPGLGLANSISGLVGGPTVGSVLAGLAGDVLGNGGTGGTGGGGTGGAGGGNGDGAGGGTGGTGGTVDNTTVDDPTKGPGNDTLVGGGGNDTLKGGSTVVDTTPKTKMIGGREYVGLDSAAKYGSGAERTFFRPWTKEVAAADGGYFDADQYFADGGLTTPTTTPGMPTTSSFPTMAFTDGQGAVGSIAQPPGVMPSDAVGFDGPNASPMAPAPSAAAPTMSVLQQNLGSRNTNASPAMAPVPQNPNVGYALGQSPLSNLRNS